MTASASTNFITSFDTMVKKQYQNGMQLRGTVRLKTGVNGSTHRFPKINKGVATPRIPQSDVTPMNIGHGYADAALTDWNAADYSDIYDLAALSFDERQELVTTATMAIGRRLDQLIIDSMAASAYSTQVSENVGGTNTGLNLAKILRAKRLLDDNGVPGTDRHIVCSARAIEQALLETEVTSGDFNVLRPLLTGELKGFAGFQIHMIEARDEGGIPVATNVRNNFAFHKDAVGLAIAIDMRTDVNWIPEKTSTLINAMFKAGAVTVETAGVIDLLTYES
jgi:hypothetical protein